MSPSADGTEISLCRELPPEVNGEKVAHEEEREERLEGSEDEEMETRLSIRTTRIAKLDRTVIILSLPSAVRVCVWMSMVVGSAGETCRGKWARVLEGEGPRVKTPVILVYAIRPVCCCLICRRKVTLLSSLVTLLSRQMVEIRAIMSTSMSRPLTDTLNHRPRAETMRKSHWIRTADRLLGYGASSMIDDNKPIRSYEELGMSN
jgi:hypothetical protein